MSWKFGAEALFFLGVVIFLVKWIGRTLLEISGSDEPRQSSEAFVQQMLQSSAATHLVERGVMSHEQLAGLSEREREVLLAETARRVAATSQIPEGATAALPHAGHPLTKAIVVHCPSCGAPINRVAQSLPFAADCPQCGRRVSARGDGPGRMSVVVHGPRH